MGRKSKKEGIYAYVWASLVDQLVKNLPAIGASLAAQMAKNLPAIQETQVQSLGQEDSPGEGNGNPLQYCCLDNPMDRGAWWATVQGVTKSRTRLSDFTSLHSTNRLPRWHSGQESICQCRRWKRVLSLGREDPLEEETATHSSIVAWKMLWPEEPGEF